MIVDQSARPDERLSRSGSSARGSWRVGRCEESVCETLRAGEAKVRVGRDRYSVTAPGGDWIGSAIQRTGRPYEQHLLRTLVQFAGRSSIVLDVGANIGNHVLYFALVRGATVHAFEPNPIGAEYLRTNIERNGAGDVHVHEVGLSDADGRGRIAPAEELGMARLERDDSSEIDVRRLDSYDLPPHPRITVMKIDVEGAEAQVLKGERIDGSARSSPPASLAQPEETTRWPAARRRTTSLRRTTQSRVVPISLLVGIDSRRNV